MILTVAAYYWLDPARQRSYQFTPDDVRRWDRMVEKHLSIPHKRVCITHRPDLIDFMETVRIDTTKHVPGTCAVKLMTYRPDIASVLGERIFVMDLDCIVTGSLDEIASRTEDVVLRRNPNYEPGGRRAYYQGSMQLLTAGARPEIWNDFDPRKTPSMVNRRFGGMEQAWITERLNKSWPEAGDEWSEASWTDDDGVYGVAREFNGKLDNGVGEMLPENARIVFTPGNIAPSMLPYAWAKENLQ